MLAIAVHEYLQGERRDEVFAAYGVTREHVDRALYLLDTPASGQDHDWKCIGVVLAAIRAPNCRVETIEVRTILADQSADERAAEWRKAGFCAAVRSRPDPALPADAAEHVRAGRTDFLLMAVRGS